MAGTRRPPAADHPGLAQGPHGWLGKQVREWQKAHGYQPGMVWDPHGDGRARCGYCGKTAHGAYVRRPQ